MTFRIVHVLQWLEVGGGEIVALELARMQRKRGHSVSLLSLRGNSGPLASRAEDQGLEVRLAGGRTSGLDISLFARVLRELARSRPHVVHTHDPASLLYAGPVARARGSVLVHTKHGDDIVGLKPRVAARLAAELSRAVVAVSQDAGEIARRSGEVPARKLRVIENGVDTSRFSPTALAEPRRKMRRRFELPDAALVVGCVARLEPVKRHELLLDALLPTLNHERRLLIAGDGSRRPQLEAKLAQHPNGRYVVMAGMLDDSLDALAALDVFVLASSHEGLPMALLEALACGLPVIASAVGGIPRVIEHGVSGLLVDLEGSAGPDRLRAALADVVRDPQRRAALGRTGQQLVRQRYSLERTCDRYLDLYTRSKGSVAG